MAESYAKLMGVSIAAIVIAVAAIFVASTGTNSMVTAQQIGSDYDPQVREIHLFTKVDESIDEDKFGVPPDLYSSEQYNSEIEEIVERTRMSYLDAMLYHADENGLESETVAGLINVKTKNKLREEAEKLNFMPKTSKLPI